MNSGDLQAKFLRDVQGTEDYLTTLFKTFIPLIITSTITYGIVIYKSWIVAIFFLLAVPLDVLLVHLFSNKIKEESREYRLANDSLSRGFTTMIEMTPVVKAHGLEDIEIESMGTRRPQRDVFADQGIELILGVRRIQRAVAVLRESEPIGIDRIIAGDQSRKIIRKTRVSRRRIAFIDIGQTIRHRPMGDQEIVIGLP